MQIRVVLERRRCVESTQRRGLKNRAQSGARCRAGALVCKYGLCCCGVVVWRVHNDQVLGFEPRVGLKVVPMHLYAITKWCLCDVIVESPQ